jgi:hypothetical protein
MTSSRTAMSIYIAARFRVKYDHYSLMVRSSTVTKDEKILDSNPDVLRAENLYLISGHYSIAHFFPLTYIFSSHFKT